MIRHIVHLRFREDVDSSAKQALYDRLAGMSSRIEGIADFQHRKNVSVEIHLVRGFLDMFWFDFRDTAVRDAYLADDLHQAIGADIVSCIDGGPDGVLVCDVEL